VTEMMMKAVEMAVFATAVVMTFVKMKKEKPV
jgi:hypothetical protein